MGHVHMYPWSGIPEYKNCTMVHTGKLIQKQYTSCPIELFDAGANTWEDARCQYIQTTYRYRSESDIASTRALLYLGGAVFWRYTWSPREADNFEFAYIRTLFSGFMWWDPAATASKTPGNMGWVHIPLCKEILEIFWVKRKIGLETHLFDVMPKYVWKSKSMGRWAHTGWWGGNLYGFVDVAD